MGGSQCENQLRSSAGSEKSMSLIQKSKCGISASDTHTLVITKVVQKRNVVKDSTAFLQKTNKSEGVKKNKKQTSC